MSRPQKTDYASYYETYVGLVPEDDILSAMKSQTAVPQGSQRPLGAEDGYDVAGDVS